MYYTASVYLALCVFLLGTLYKISSWFRHGVGVEAQGISTRRRLAAVGKTDNLPLLLAATITSFLGAFLGNRLMQKVTMRNIQILVSMMLLGIAVLLGLGLI